jgi:hypothetical protein
MQKKMLKYPSVTEIKAIYSSRQASLNSLIAMKCVNAQDLDRLDRGGRFRVADELWDLCSPSAKQALLNDPHPHVRSTARISWRS